MTNTQRPSVGRIVHFMPQDNGPCRAAIITDVHSDTVVDLDVRHAGEMQWRNGVYYNEEHRQGSWHWPERV